jgi:hypothetical protein
MEAPAERQREAHLDAMAGIDERQGQQLEDIGWQRVQHSWMVGLPV